MFTNSHYSPEVLLLLWLASLLIQGWPMSSSEDQLRSTFLGGALFR